MFVPTIKYKRVDNVQDTIDSVAQLRIGDNAKQSNPISTVEKYNEAEKKPPVATATPEKKEETAPIKEEPKAKVEPKTEEPKKEEPKAEPTTTPRAQDEPTIDIDPSDKDRILITLTNGQKYTADRYCPHAGADLTYLGEVAEDEYPPEIGPVLLCTLHYWEFALEKAGRSGGGWATLNACPVAADQCPAETNKKLDW